MDMTLSRGSSSSQKGAGLRVQARSILLESLESNGLIQSEGIDRRNVYSITSKGVVALDLMTKEKLELLNEMSRIINSLTERDDNPDAGCEAGNILGMGGKPEKERDIDSRSLKTDKDRR